MFQLDEPEAITPVKTRYYEASEAALKTLLSMEVCPIQVTSFASRGGYQVELPLEPLEMVLVFN